MKFAQLPLLAAACAVAGSAQAADLYGSIGYTQFETREFDASLGAAQGRFGARLAPHLGIEGELAVGVDDDQVDMLVVGYAWNEELKYQAGLYAVGFLPITENAEVFARLGFGYAKLNTKASYLGQSMDVDRTEDAFSFGVGAQYFFAGANGVRIDYTRHEFGQRSADSWAAAYVRRF
ncbi:MAG: porin family protein [Phenylobacterium sp.]|uniref:outer membrane beta-barrel protein n=1 Tax=Phenylobacterium sp. TaxID=1871053 RepID=UPI0025FF5DD8|nr:outer membrane beta-barrel protein [Phenylobacterium sp.]MBA4013835.1 porin family protein [Phenylobacterium sp.]